MKNQVFITGTGTNIGKTLFAGALCQKSNAVYHKLIQSGFPNDSETIEKIIGQDRIIKEQLLLKAPLSPLHAAQKENFFIDFDKLIVPKAKDRLVVIEGSGGIMTPITASKTMLDYIKKFNLETILVTKNELGCINHTLMSVQVLKHARINLLGIAIVGANPKHNISAIKNFSKEKILYILDKGVLYEGLAALHANA